MRFARNSGWLIVADEIPLVCFDPDILRLLDLTPRQLQRLRKHHVFPIPELLPPLDRRHRYARRDVLAYVNREQTGRMAVVRKKTG
jgi:hypothetical protein